MEVESRFKNKPLEERIRRYEELKTKHPGKIPLVIERNSLSKLTGSDSFRFVSKPATKFSHFSNQIRTALKLDQKAQLFFVNENGAIIKPESTIEEIAKKALNEDGFLYIVYQEVQSFGT